MASAECSVVALAVPVAVAVVAVAGMHGNAAGMHGNAAGMHGNAAGMHGNATGIHGNAGTRWSHAEAVGALYFTLPAAPNQAGCMRLRCD